MAEAKSFEEMKVIVEQAYKVLSSMNTKREDEVRCFNPSELKLVQQGFTDKLIIVKDQYYLKLIHRDSNEDPFEIGHHTSFSEAPRTLDDRVTLTMLH